MAQNRDTMDKKNSIITLPLDILGLSNIEIESTKINVDENEIFIRVNSTEKEIPCRLCGRPTEPYGRGRELTLRLICVWNAYIYIDYTTPRNLPLL